MEISVNNKEFFMNGNRVKVLVVCYFAGLSSIEIYECSSMFDALKTTWEYLEKFKGGYVDWKIYKDKILKEVISEIEGITRGTVVKLVF